MKNQGYNPREIILNRICMCYGVCDMRMSERMMCVAERESDV